MDITRLRNLWAQGDALGRSGEVVPTRVAGRRGNGGGMNFDPSQPLGGARTIEEAELWLDRLTGRVNGVRIASTRDPWSLAIEAMHQERLARFQSGKTGLRYAQANPNILAALHGYRRFATAPGEEEGAAAAGDGFPTAPDYGAAGAAPQGAPQGGGAASGGDGGQFDWIFDPDRMQEMEAAGMMEEEGVGAPAEPVPFGGEVTQPTNLNDRTLRSPKETGSMNHLLGAFQGAADTLNTGFNDARAMYRRETKSAERQLAQLSDEELRAKIPAAKAETQRLRAQLVADLMRSRSSMSEDDAKQIAIEKYPEIVSVRDVVEFEKARIRDRAADDLIRKMGLSDKGAYRERMAKQFLEQYLLLAVEQAIKTDTSGRALAGRDNEAANDIFGEALAEFWAKDGYKGLMEFALDYIPSDGKEKGNEKMPFLKIFNQRIWNIVRNARNRVLGKPTDNAKSRRPRSVSLDETLKGGGLEAGTTFLDNLKSPEDTGKVLNALTSDFDRLKEIWTSLKGESERLLGLRQIDPKMRVQIQKLRDTLEGAKARARKAEIQGDYATVEQAEAEQQQAQEQIDQLMSQSLGHSYQQTQSQAGEHKAAIRRLEQQLAHDAEADPEEIKAQIAEHRKAIEDLQTSREGLFNDALGGLERGELLKQKQREIQTLGSRYRQFGVAIKNFQQLAAQDPELVAAVSERESAKEGIERAQMMLEVAQRGAKKDQNLIGRVQWAQRALAEAKRRFMQAETNLKRMRDSRPDKGMADAILEAREKVGGMYQNIQQAESAIYGPRMRRFQEFFTGGEGAGTGVSDADTLADHIMPHVAWDADYSRSKSDPNQMGLVTNSTQLIDLPNAWRGLVGDAQDIAQEEGAEPSESAQFARIAVNALMKTFEFYMREGEASRYLGESDSNRGLAPSKAEVESVIKPSLLGHLEEELSASPLGQNPESANWVRSFVRSLGSGEEIVNAFNSADYVLRGAAYDKARRDLPKLRQQWAQKFQQLSQQAGSELDAMEAEYQGGQVPAEVASQMDVLREREGKYRVYAQKAAEMAQSGAGAPEWDQLNSIDAAVIAHAVQNYFYERDSAKKQNGKFTLRTGRPFFFQLDRGEGEDPYHTSADIREPYNLGKDDAIKRNLSDKNHPANIAQALMQEVNGMKRRYQVGRDNVGRLELGEEPEALPSWVYKQKSNGLLHPSKDGGNRGDEMTQIKREQMSAEVQQDRWLQARDMKAKADFDKNGQLNDAKTYGTKASRYYEGLKARQEANPDQEPWMNMTSREEEIYNQSLQLGLIVGDTGGAVAGGAEGASDGAEPKRSMGLVSMDGNTWDLIINRELQILQNKQHGIDAAPGFETGRYSKKPSIKLWGLIDNGMAQRVFEAKAEKDARIKGLMAHGVEGITPLYPEEKQLLDGAMNKAKAPEPAAAGDAGAAPRGRGRPSLSPEKKAVNQYRRDLEKQQQRAGSEPVQPIQRQLAMSDDELLELIQSVDKLRNKYLPGAVSGDEKVAEASTRRFRRTATASAVPQQQVQRIASAMVATRQAQVSPIEQLRSPEAVQTLLNRVRVLRTAGKIREANELNALLAKVLLGDRNDRDR